MKNLSQTIKENVIWIIGVIVILGIYSYFHWYIPYHHLQQGYVVVSGFDCPKEHPIKAHIGSTSNIYHVPGDTYYNRTSASNGDCFDTVEHAVMQGFRAPYN